MAINWLDRINQADKAEKQWRIRAGKIIKKYRSDDGVDLQGNRQSESFNILWSNVETLAPALYNRTPKPDISTVPALKNALLNAKSVAYSASASGTYLSEELFAKLGVADRMKVTAKKIMSERVGAVVARGDAELGFQQASELLPFTELDYLGPIPDEVQQKVFFSAGVLQGAPNPEGAKRFIRYLASPAAAGVIESTGLTPVAKR